MGMDAYLHIAKKKDWLAFKQTTLKELKKFFELNGYSESIPAELSIRMNSQVREMLVDEVGYFRNCRSLNSMFDLDSFSGFEYVETSINQITHFFQKLYFDSDTKDSLLDYEAVKILNGIAESASKIEDFNENQKKYFYPSGDLVLLYSSSW